ncbi:MAG: ComEA family DNA-binding protein [Sciscionella sp.]|nr:ComEA family DNA-binding protein [Sciscionella sp.]
MVQRWIPGGDRTARILGDTLQRHRGLVVGAVVVVIAAIVAALSLGTATPSAESPPALPAAAVDTSPSASAAGASGAAGKIVISVVGKVRRPGLVTLPDGARVADAVRAAGGTLAGTDVTTLNMARKLTDGEQIYVGIPVPPQAAQPGAVSGDVAGGASSADTQSTVDLNTANAEQLDALPGIGEVTAKRIIDWRTQHGRFTSVDDLQQVDGIGPAKFAQLKSLVTVQ